MPSPTSISLQKLARLVGTPKSPAIIDVRTDEDFAADPRLIPGSVRRAHDRAAEWAEEFASRSGAARFLPREAGEGDRPKGGGGGDPEHRARGPLHHASHGPPPPFHGGGSLPSEAVTVCQRGQKLSEGAAAWLRHAGVPADVLEGGFAAWAEAGLPLVPAEKVPPRDAQGRTVWVTRARPKIDRIACPWLIRRFVDPSAVFLFVAPAEVEAVAERFSATPFDVEHVFWSHRGDLCSFDVMVEEFGLSTEPLLRLARIVRGADTARLDLAPQAAGLLAVSLGLSRMYSDDLRQLEAGMTLYDALYLWCRDAVDEAHNWPSAKAPAGGRV